MRPRSASSASSSPSSKTGLKRRSKPEKRGEREIERITEVAGEHPLRERLRTLQMTAPFPRWGGGPEALAVYDDLRQSLAHELGLSPSPAVVRCYQSLLSEREPAGPGNGGRFPAPAGAAEPAALGPARLHRAGRGARRT